MKTNNIKFSEASGLLEEGDVLLFRGSGWFSFFIKRAGEGRYSHAAVASSHGTNGGIMWECVEFREGAGGRTINLKDYAEQNSGIIDVYRPVSSYKKIKFDAETNTFEEKETNFDGKGVTNIMRKMTGLPYGWKRILWILQHKMAFVRLFYKMDSVVDDETKDLIYPVCSTAVAYSYNRMGYDLLNNRADKATEPSDISKSPLLNYIFTLKD